MKALILAAGEGTRLGSLTAEIPKPMLSIGGRPIIEHNVRLLRASGVDHIVINLHHRPHPIVAHFGDGRAFGVAIEYSYEPTLLGTAGALGKVRDQFAAEDFFLVYGDNLTTCDLGALQRLHQCRRSVLTMALFHRADPTASGIVGLDAHDRIVRFLEKPKTHEVFSNWVNAGYLMLSPNVLELIPESGPSDFGRDIFGRLLSEGSRIYGYRMSERLWWVDTPEDFARTQEDVARNPLPNS